MNYNRDKTIVIGGGPGGASAAIYLARFNHEVLLLDAAHTIHGRTAWAYELENVLGFTHPIPGPDYLRSIHTQLAHFNIERREETVTQVLLLADGMFEVFTNLGRYVAGHVIVAVGVHDIMPDIPDAETYYGHSIFPCPACNWYQTKNRPTGIVTTSDRGLITALAFNDMQKGSVKCVVTDRPDNSFSPNLRSKVEAVGIEVYTSPLICVNGQGTNIHSITLADTSEILLEILYIRLGIKRHDVFLNNKSLVELLRDEEGYIMVDFANLESSIPNLYAVGPCNNGPDQVVIAAGQGATAGLEIHTRILTGHGI